MFLKSLIQFKFHFKKSMHVIQLDFNSDMMVKLQKFFFSFAKFDVQMTWGKLD